MYHTYPYKAQIPVLIDGSYQKRTFTSNDNVWDVIRLIVEETKQANLEGGDFSIGSSVMAQLPFFACPNIMTNSQSQKDISRFVYSRDYNVQPYPGAYGEQPYKWVEKSFVINNIIQKEKAKAVKNG
tara:strand:- start:37 stop:417 length:381 start_codon:yes stop_codon:yes gene_type:complete